jgi:RNA polymerase sigma-70 factor (ECF subfamily)
MLTGQAHIGTGNEHVRVSIESSRAGLPPGAEPPDETGPPTDTSALDGDFDGFYQANFRRLTVQLCAYTGDLPLAQDLVQEAFCRAFAKWKSVSRYDDPAAWVRRVAWNLATSRWRRMRVAHSFLRGQREQHIAGPGPDRVHLVAALARLPEKHRRVVVLHHLTDLSVAEIAQQEGVAEGTVKSWLHRGRTALAAALTENEEGTRNV